MVVTGTVAFKDAVVTVLIQATMEAFTGTEPVAALTNAGVMTGATVFADAVVVAGAVVFADGAAVVSVVSTTPVVAVMTAAVIASALAVVSIAVVWWTCQIGGTVNSSIFFLIVA